MSDCDVTQMGEIMAREAEYNNIMEMFEFKNVKELDDVRSIFGNRVCKLLYQKYNGNLEEAMKEGEIFFDEFEILIRNIYEIVEQEIPLYALFRLRKYGADNFGFDDDEYLNAETNCIVACGIYYK